MGLQVIPILCRAGTMDNYSYLIIDQDTKINAIIDPSEAKPIIDTCNKYQITPNYIFNTHHHFDHTDANLAIKQHYNCKIVGAEADKHRIPEIDITVAYNSQFKLGNSTAQIIEAQGHTHGHILWYFPQDKILFTGDTLFNLCIGGLFEGTPEEMYNTLQTIKKLPEDTLFYPGHEYTLHGLNDAMYINQHKPEMKEYLHLIQQRLNNHQSVAPIPLKLEKECNPYLSASNLVEFSHLVGC